MDIIYLLFYSLLTIFLIIVALVFRPLVYAIFFKIKHGEKVVINFFPFFGIYRY